MSNTLNVENKTDKQDHYLEQFSGAKPNYFNTKEYLEYRRLWKECPENFIVPNFPINLDLHITNKCNLKCPFCPRTWNDMAGLNSD